MCDTEASRRPLRLALIAALAALVGCSAVGVPASSDPAVKIQQANTLVTLGRLTVARNLLGEALNIYEARGDELGIAETYRQLGIFYQWPPPQVNQYRLVPDDYGGTTPDGVQMRYLVAMDWFERSLALYEKLNDHASVSNVRFLMARTYHVYLKNDPAACSSFAASRAAHLEAVKIDPSVRYTATSGYKTFEEQIDAAERYLKCEPDA